MRLLSTAVVLGLALTSSACARGAHVSSSSASTPAPTLAAPALPDGVTMAYTVDHDLGPGARLEIRVTDGSAAQYRLKIPALHK